MLVKTDIPAVKHLHPEAVIEEDLVVGFLGEVEASDGEDDLAMRVVEVDEVRRHAAKGMVVGGALDDRVGIEAVATGGRVLGAAEVLLVDREYEAADAGDGLELSGSGEGPRVAVVGAHVGAPLPRPPATPRHHHALHPTQHRHFLGWRVRTYLA